MQLDFLPQMDLLQKVTELDFLHRMGLIALGILAVNTLVILGAMLAMAIGVMAGRKPISGSCGGLNSSGGCELCSNRGACRRRKNEPGA